MSGTGGLKTSQVAILASKTSDKDWSSALKTVSSTNDLRKWRAGQGVLISPWRRFKGLEADAIVIIEDFHQSESLTEKANHYVARSRAKHLLSIIQITS
jgi:hypothetical protein